MVYPDWSRSVMLPLLLFPSMPLPDFDNRLTVPPDGTQGISADTPASRPAA